MLSNKELDSVSEYMMAGSKRLLKGKRGFEVMEKEDLVSVSSKKSRITKKAV